MQPYYLNRVIIIFLLATLCFTQLSAQNMFFHPFTFMEVGMEQTNQTWAVFEDDGRYAATGMCPEGFFVARTDYNGDSLSFNTYNDGLSVLYMWNHGSWYSGTDGYKIITVQDSIFLFDSEWNKTSLSPIAGVPHPRNVAILSDGNFVFINRGGSFVYTLVKVNSQTKEVIWTSDQLTQNFNPRGQGFYFKELIVLPDGGILAVARDYYYDSVGPIWFGSTLFKIDPEGHLVSTFISPDVYYYHTYYEDGLFTSLILEDFNYYDEDNLHYVTTHTAEGQEIARFAITAGRYGCYILKDGEKVLVLEKERSKKEMVLEAYTANGNHLWSSRYTITSQYRDVNPRMVITTTDGGYLIYGDIYPSGNSNSLPFFLKTNESGQSAPLAVQVNNIPNPYHIYPNPAINQIRITGNEFSASGNLTDISIFDTRGVLRLSAANSPLPLTLDITTLSPGLYILKLTRSEKVEVMKFVKE